MNSVYIFIFPICSDQSLGYTINIIPSVLHVVLLQFMPYHILPQPSGQWVLSGLIGSFQWNSIVEILDHNIRSKWFPYPSINKYVTSQAQLTHVILLYGLHDQLSLHPPQSHAKDLKLSLCESNTNIGNLVTDSTY